MATQAPSNDQAHPAIDPAGRRAAMAVLVESDAAELARLLATVPELPAYKDIRQPESGLTMVRARIGGDGPPFNLGEATVARAAVRLASGEVGFGYVLGREHEKARLVALCDALFQSDRYRPHIERCVLQPIRARSMAARQLAAERTAATRVEFFTLVRGEDS
jgi:alpha-D-ribose 1-methylphosphonate 5-triphosphate synthase subunit PhnG